MRSGSRLYSWFIDHSGTHHREENLTQGKAAQEPSQWLIPIRLTDRAHAVIEILIIRFEDAAVMRLIRYLGYLRASKAKSAQHLPQVNFSIVHAVL